MRSFFQATNIKVIKELATNTNMFPERAPSEGTFGTVTGATTGAVTGAATGTDEAGAGTTTLAGAATGAAATGATTTAAGLGAD